MAINVAGLIPASIKSKNVATEDYVDTSVASNTSSSNLIKNSEMIIESTNTGIQWLRSDLWHGRKTGLDPYTAGVTRNKIGEYSPYTLLNGSTAWIHQNGTESGFSADIVFDDDGGQFTYLGHMVSQLEWYQVSGYIGSINCTAKIVVVFSDSVGQIVNQVVGEALTGKPGGSYLEDFHNYYINVQVPEGARYATIMFRKYGTTSGSDSLMFVSKPQFINTVGSSTRRIPYSENGNASGLSGMAYADMRNVTTIDGSKITTGTIDALQIASDAIAGKTITGGTINGAIINGVQINGAIIKGSFIDLTSTIALTNWQLYTPATIPPAYAANFAHNNNGTLTVDSSGFVRLPGQQNFIVGKMVKNATYFTDLTLGNTHAYPTVNLNETYDLYSWDSYKINTLQRSIYKNTKFASSADLVFEGEVISNKDSGSTGGTALLNITNYYFTIFDKNVRVKVVAIDESEYRSTTIYINNTAVKGTTNDNFYYNLIARGITTEIRVVFAQDGNQTSSHKFTSTVKIVTNSEITGHTINDVLSIINITNDLNNYGTSVGCSAICKYSINYPSVVIQ